MIKLTYYDEVYVKVECELSLAHELHEHFCFYAPNYKWNPKFKSGFWDGKIHLFSVYTRLIYVGLIDKIREFAEERNITFIPLPERRIRSREELVEFANSLSLPFSLYEYQIDAFVSMVQDRRKVLIIPTSGGKTVVAYILARWLCQQKKKILIICPTMQLVKQMHDNFVDEYAKDDSLDIHMIMDGSEKTNRHSITVSTWQSIYGMSADWFNEFHAILGDEAHGFNAKSLKGIMELSTNVPIKVGMTGSLDGMPVNELVLEGLFGPIVEMTTYKELLEDGRIPNFRINVLLLQHPDSVVKEFAKSKKMFEYKSEIDFLILNEDRNNIIKKLVSVLPGNCLVLYSLVGKHGKPLFKKLSEELPNKKVMLVHGDIDLDDRHEVVQSIEQNDNVVAVCSYKTFSTGVSAKNLHHVIFASPTKSQITVVQSIGRGLRLHPSKSMLNVWDIADDIRTPKRINHTYRHLEQRIDIYNSKEFDFKFITKRI